jgi:hypothetical protein
VSQLNNILENKEPVFIVDVEISSSDSRIYSLTVLSRQREEIDFQFPLFQERDLFPFQKFIQKGVPVCLVVNGRGVIHRTLDLKFDTDNKIILKQTLPDANPDDFYIQKSRMQRDDAVVVSIVRKNVVDSVIEDFSKLGCLLVGLSIGPFEIQNVLKLLPSKNSFRYKNLLIQYNAQGLLGFETEQNEEQEKVMIENQEIVTDCIPSLAVGFTFLLGGSCNFPQIPLVDESCVEHSYKKKSDRLMKISLVVFFLLLLISYLLFDHFYKKAEDLRTDIQRQEQLIYKMNELNKSYSSKSKFLQQSGMLGQTHISLYLDMIAQTIPTSITLDEINVNPPVNAAGKKELRFSKNKIKISGTSKDSYEFNEWFKKLKAEKKFSDTYILKYEFKDKEKKALFTIEINVEL